MRHDSRRSFLLSLAGIGAASAAGRMTAGCCSPLSEATVARSDGRYVNPRKVLLWECTRKEIREALESGRLKAAIVPTGSTEQHNEHLAMIHDTASALLVAQQAALQLYPRVIIATPVAVGISPHWMERPGTLTLRSETFLAVVFDICESLKIHGLKNILILNGHGGNEKPLKTHLAELRAKLRIDVDACSYWEAYTSSPEITEEVRKIVKTSMENVPGHSGEFETSFALAAFPEHVHRQGVDYDKVKLALKDPEDLKSDRNFYYESLDATAEKGEVLIGMAVDWTVAKLRSMMAQP